jgi:predicted ATPase/DNA-binding CsgD family transcriptional regulator
MSLLAESLPDPQPEGRRGLPDVSTPFFGRERELAEIGGLLGNPNCRLLTLLGPGGIGKTRLAAESAARFAHYFPDGVILVSLQAALSAESLLSAVADALALPLTGRVTPYEQLLSTLRARHTLLLLDNFEQLLDGPFSAGGEPAKLLSALLTDAPGLRLLVTSREVLNLREEWLYPLDGLDVPADDGPALEASSAVQLFAERARRLRRDFQLDHERLAVARVCRLVEGMPLAIELAAAWTKTLPCATIADEIARGIQLLTSNMRNLPERHRSVRAAFDQSWALLDAQERQVFAQFSVFRVGFTRQAAEAVLETGTASLPLLAALVDKSLLRHEVDELRPEGRYHIHELLRQYAEQQLQAAGDERTTRQAHAAFYGGFLAGRLAALLGEAQVVALSAIADELPNIRAAWQWAVAEADTALIARASQPLLIYYHLRGPYAEGIAALGAAAACLRALPAHPQRDAVLAELLVDLAWLHIRLGQVAQAQAALDESLALLGPEAPAPPGMATDPQIARTVLALISGDYARARELGLLALRRAEQQGHVNNLPHAFFVLADAALSQGDLQAALQYAEQAYSAVLVARDRWYLAYVHGMLGNIAVYDGAFDEAQRHFQVGYSIREEFGDPEGMAVALSNLGDVALLQGQADEARARFERAQAIYGRIGDRGGLSRALDGLGACAAAAGDYAGSARLFAEALALAAAIPFVRAILTTTLNVAALFKRLGQQARAQELLCLVRFHPAASGQQRQRAQKLLGADQAEPEPGSAADLQTVVARLRLELDALALNPLPAPERARPHPSQAAPGERAALVEPLTEREREVLALIGQGFSNQEIAEQLVLSVGTVKWYAAQIYGKLGVQTRTQAIARATTLGLLVG